MKTIILSLAELEHYDSRARSSGRERRFCCPLCGDSKPKDADHRSLAVNTETGEWVCHRCEKSGKLQEWWTDPATDRQQERRTRRRHTLQLTPTRDPAPDPESVAGFQQQAARLKSFVGSPAESYLTGRGIPSALAALCGVKFSPVWSHSEAKRRPGFPAVVFPCRDGEGKPIAGIGRGIQSSAKITYGPKSLGVFATPGALDADPVAVTEAPIDALSLALAGLPALAISGTDGVPQWLITRLAKAAGPGRSRTVFTATDADTAGDAAAVKLSSKLVLVRVERLRPEGVKDWNELLTGQGIEALCEQVDAALWNTLQILPDRPDPRPELTDDSSAWIRLLGRTADTELYGPLHGFRCYGARLGAAGLEYDQDRDGFATTDDFTRQYDKWIQPHAELLAGYMEAA